jgi:hypothetical protein
VHNNGARDTREHGRTSALHDTSDFGTLRPRSQITGMPLLRILFVSILCIALGVMSRASAESTDDEGPTAQPTVDAALKQLIAQYGPAAVSLQGSLLETTISAGSQLEISVSLAGKESRAGRDYLAYTVDTGIVYQIAEVTKREQLSRIWTDVVDPSLRKATALQLPGDGIILRIRSYRGEFADRAAIIRELEAQRLQPVATTFILPLDAVRGFVSGTVTAAELTARGVVELDGMATELVIVPTPVPTDEPTAEP